MAHMDKLVSFLVVLALLGVWIPGGHAAHGRALHEFNPSTAARKLQAAPTLVLLSSLREPTTLAEYNGIANQLSKDDQIIILTKLVKQSEAHAAACSTNTSAVQAAKSTCDTDVQGAKKDLSGETAAVSALQGDISQVKIQLSGCDTAKQEFEAGNVQCDGDLDQCLNDKSACDIAKGADDAQCTRDLQKTKADARTLCDGDLQKMDQDAQAELAAKVLDKDNQCDEAKTALRTQVEQDVQSSEATACEHAKDGITKNMNDDCNNAKGQLQQDCDKGLEQKDALKSAMEADIRSQIADKVAIKEECQITLGTTTDEARAAQDAAARASEEKSEKIKQLEEVKAIEESDIQQRTQKRDELQAQRSLLNEAVTTLKTQIDNEQRAHVTDVAACKSTAASQAQDMQEVIDQKEGIITSKKEAKTQLDQQAAIDKAEIAHLKEEGATAKEEHDGCKADAQEAQERQEAATRALRSRVEAAEQDDDDCQTELGNCNADVAVKREQISNLSNAINQLETEADSAVKHSEQLSRSNDELGHSAGQLESEMQALAEDKTNLHDSINTEQHGKDELIQQANGAQDAAQHFADQAAAVTGEIQDKDDEIADSLSDVESIEKQVKAQQESNALTAVQVRGKADEAAAAATSAQQAAQLLQSAEGELDQVNVRIVNLSSDRTALRKSLKSLAAIVDKYNARHGPIDRLRYELEHFDADFTKYTKVVYDDKSVKAALKEGQTNVDISLVKQPSP